MNSQNSKPRVQYPGTMTSTASLHLPPLLLTFIPLLSGTYLHQSRLSSTCILFLLQIAMSYPNIMVHRDSCLHSSVNLSITTANKELTALKPLSLQLQKCLTVLMFCTILMPFSSFPSFLMHYHTLFFCHQSYTVSRFK